VLQQYSLLHFNLDLHFQSEGSLFHETWQKKPVSVSDYLSIERTTLKIHRGAGSLTRKIINQDQKDRKSVYGYADPGG